MTLFQKAVNGTSSISEQAADRCKDTLLATELEIAQLV